MGRVQFAAARASILEKALSPKGKAVTAEMAKDIVKNLTVEEVKQFGEDGQDIFNCTMAEGEM
eukprot:1008009-Prorocentrum_lima.AAC.1